MVQLSDPFAYVLAFCPDLSQTFRVHFLSPPPPPPPPPSAFLMEAYYSITLSICMHVPYIPFFSHTMAKCHIDTFLVYLKTDVVYAHCKHLIEIEFWLFHLWSRHTESILYLVSVAQQALTLYSTLTPFDAFKISSIWKYYGKSSICSFGANAPFSIIFLKVFKA